MKIEKLTENKIRVLLNNEDIEDKNIDLHTLMTKALESQGLFLEMLNQAEEEVGFDTDGYKLLIEAYASSDNDFIFTITKYLEENVEPSNVRKKAVPRAILPKFSSKFVLFSFHSFDDFCGLCSYLNSSKVSVRGLAKSVCLYKIESTYYLAIKNLNTSKVDFKTLVALFSEFGDLIDSSSQYYY